MAPRVLAAVVGAMALLLIVVLPTACDAEQSVLLLRSGAQATTVVPGADGPSGPTERSGVGADRSDAHASGSPKFGSAGSVVGRPS